MKSKFISLLQLLFLTFLALMASSIHCRQPSLFLPEGCRVKNGSSGVKVYCVHLNLTSVPQGIPTKTKTLDLSYNNIIMLHNDSFRNLTELSALNLRGNQICSMENGTFKPLAPLAVLDLIGNHLSELQPDLFNSNGNLSVVLLSCNNFTSVPTKALQVLPQLRKLFLSNNLIKVADFSAFAKVKTNVDIDLASNDISSVKESDFKPLVGSSVHQLSLRSNKLCSLPPKAFSHLEKVVLLDLGNNNLKNLEIVSFYTNLEIRVLNLEGSSIYNIVPLNNSEKLNVSFPQIETLILMGNNVHLIPNKAFQGFHLTRSLTLRKNKIRTFYNESFCGLSALKAFDLSENEIKYLQGDMFLCNPNLETLDISKNNIIILFPVAFNGLHSLLHLNLSRNSMRRCDERYSWSNPSLELIDISFNKFRKVVPEMLQGQTNLQIVDLSSNDIAIYSPYAFSHLSSLRKLYLVNEGKQYMYGVFSGMSNLEVLDVSETDIVMNSKNQFTHAESLEVLRMKHNNLRSKDLYDSKTNSSLFTGLKSLKHLVLQGNHLKSLNPHVFDQLKALLSLDLSSSEMFTLQDGLFSRLSSLTKLDLSNNLIIKTTSNTFRGLVNLRDLLFSRNSLEFIAIDVFNATPQLNRLFLSQNKISSVRSNTIFPKTPTRLTIDISKNPFSCTCDLSWFRGWLHTSNIDLKHPNDTLCAETSLTGLTNKPILSFNPQEFCGVNISLICGLAVVFCSIATCCILIYHKRWWFSYKLFLIRLVIFGYQEVEEDAEDDFYEYQLNIMYLEADEEWVAQFMRPTLQARFPHIERIVYGDNDLNIGMFYINAIYYSIVNSYKNVILLSNRCVDDAWFMMKLRMALEHLNVIRLDKIILVFLEDIDDDRMPYLVRLYLIQNKRYMLWTEDEDGQELFWAQFEKSMRSNRALHKIIPV